MKKNITIKPITKESTNLLKGIAIILIVLHNYYKWINPITGENEFGFSLSHIIKSYIFLRSNPLELINVFFNFLGHYGVQAFIFISAYGLTKSWQRRNLGYSSFFLHRLNRIYPSLLLAAVVFLIHSIIKNDGQFPGLDVLGDLGIQLSLLANFFPGKTIAITGPWWFYSMIFQFYLLFPFFMWINKKAGVTGLIALAVFGYVFRFLLFDPLDKLSLNTQFFLPGHLPEFCLGIFFASRKGVKISVWIIILALVVFIGGNLVEWIWPFASLSVALMIILLLQPIFRQRTKNSKKYPVLSFFGIISMYLFACHGFLRSELLTLASRLESPLAALLISLIFLLFTAGIAFLMKQIEQLIRDWIGKTGTIKYNYLRIVFLLGIIVVGLFGLSMVDSKEEKSEQKRMSMLHTIYNDFEEVDPVHLVRYTDSISFKGKTSYYMPPEQSFTTPTEVDFDTIQVDGLSEIFVSTLIFTEDTLAEGHIILEIYDKPTNYRIVWTAETFNASKENYKYAKWFTHQFTYQVPHYFLKSNYLVKVYLWNNSPGSFYIDNFELTLKARQK